MTLESAIVEPGTAKTMSAGLYGELALHPRPEMFRGVPPDAYSLSALLRKH
ncbi:MAG: hypothetical protein M3Z50_09790 [Actinomycetota bacterium]|nr:hypothetical protein [Actinomycetota bacterium]